MEQNVFDVLKERGFIEQTTHEAEIRELLGKEKVTFYIGFDATADSLTAGHFLTIMAMMHMQRAGHRPIALLGGGTTMIGDPSGKSDMRNMMTKEKSITMQSVSMNSFPDSSILTMTMRSSQTMQTGCWI